MEKDKESKTRKMKGNGTIEKDKESKKIRRKSEEKKSKEIKKRNKETEEKKDKTKGNKIKDVLPALRDALACVCVLGAKTTAKNSANSSVLARTCMDDVTLR